MTLRFIEGFELNAANSASSDQYYERKFSQQSGVPGIGGGAFTGSSLGSSSFAFTTPVFSAQDVWIVHWWWFFAEVATVSQNAYVRLEDSSGEQFGVYVEGTGGGGTDTRDRFNVLLKRGATTLATVGPFWAGEWHSFQLKVTIDPTTGSYELKVNDVSEASDAGPVNTANQGVANADRAMFSLDNGIRTMYLDHVLVMDDQGSVNNDFPGECCVAHALPDSEGDDLDWDLSTGSTHYLLVNEAMPSGNVVSTEDPKRITSETVSDIDRWQMSNIIDLGYPSGTAVLGVSVETCAAMEASGTRDLRPVFKDTTTATAEGDSFSVTSTAFDVYLQIWETNPATAATWSITTIDAGQFGVKVQA